MMLRPTIAELTKGKINRYELAIATAKCACQLTEDYNRQKELAEKAALAGKDADFVVELDKELEDVKAVRVAIDRIYSGQYKIVRLTDEQIKERQEAKLAAEKQQMEEIFARSNATPSFEDDEDEDDAEVEDETDIEESAEDSESED